MELVMVTCGVAVAIRDLRLSGLVKCQGRDAPNDGNLVGEARVSRDLVGRDRQQRAERAVWTHPHKQCPVDGEKGVETEQKLIPVLGAEMPEGTQAQDAVCDELRRDNQTISCRSAVHRPAARARSHAP